MLKMLIVEGDPAIKDVLKLALREGRVTLFDTSFDTNKVTT
jgi:hypothetical protein